MKDIDMLEAFPHSACDERGRLRVGAAIGVHDHERAQGLVEAGVDVLVVDTAHGHSTNVIDTVRELKRRYTCDVVAGNVATAEATRALVEAGADGVKVGIGPGSICTTRIVAGVGVPQLTAICRLRRGAARDGRPPDRRRRRALLGRRGQGPRRRRLLRHDRQPVRRRGGEPGRDHPLQGAHLQVGARHGLARRHGRGRQGALPPGRRRDRKKLVPEGIEGMVPYKGRLSDFVYQLVGGLRAGMGYVGAPTSPCSGSGRASCA
jgi:IMP dehydrogenase